MAQLSCIRDLHKHSSARLFASLLVTSSLTASSYMIAAFKSLSTHQSHPYAKTDESQKFSCVPEVENAKW